MHAVPAVPNAPAVSSKLVGVLGGMGPSATVDFYAKLIAHTPARTDQDHLRVIIWADPTVPSRQEAILDGGTDPSPWLEAGVDHLVNCGAEIVVVPCNTVHRFLPAVMAGKPVEFISIVDATMAAVRAGVDGRAIGVLATDGALASGIFQQALEGDGYEVLLPSDSEQQQVMDTVHGVKAGEPAVGLRSRVRTLLRSLHERGAHGVVVGCTELSALMADGFEETEGSQVTIIDPAVELAKATVERATA